MNPTYCLCEEVSVGATSFTLSNGQMADSLGHVIHVISNDRSQEIGEKWQRSNESTTYAWGKSKVL